MPERSKADRPDATTKPGPGRRAPATAPAGGTPEDAIATRGEPEARQVAAGPSTATTGRRRAERPEASPTTSDATAPTSGTRSGPTGSATGGGRTTTRPPGGSTASRPTMPGPSGPAQTTELVGGPGAASPVGRKTAAGSSGVLLAPPAGAPARGRPQVTDDDEREEANGGPFPTPGGGGTGPVDPIYDVERVQRALARRAGGVVRSPTARR